MTARPVYGITVLRYADGRTELCDPWDTQYQLRTDNNVVSMPEAWQHRHAMLIDACEVVKREAGVSEPAFRASGAIASAQQEGE